MNDKKVILKTDHAGIVFGGLHAVDNFTIEIKENELVGLIGPNGAGKTTVFNLLTGVYTPTFGKIYLCGKNVTHTKPHIRCKEGISRTFQNIRLFKQLSVLDNIKNACNMHMQYSLFDAIFRTKKFWKIEKEVDTKAKEILSILGLDDCYEEQAMNLPYGKQRKLEMARALATDPKVLLLDEPAAGMNPTETEELMQIIKLIKDKFNISILLIEHDMKLVMGICERIVVLNYGKIIAQGTPDEIVHNQEVVEAYLGK